MKKHLALVLLIALPAFVSARMSEEDINLELSASILSESNAKIFPGSEIRTVPLNDGDTELVVGWPESNAYDWPMLRAALELYTWPTHMLDGSKARFVDNPIIDGTEYPGKWRQATISRVRQPQQGDSFTYWIVLTLRSGYATSASWDEARLTQYTRSESTTNNLGTNVIANTTGIDPVEYAVVRFPNINPYKISEIIASLNQEAYTNQTVYGETLSGAWYNVMVTGGKEDDGTGYVDLVLSRQRYTVETYDFYGTIRQSSVYRIFNIPKTIAQDIIDAWKSDGRSSSIDYNPRTELCTVTLRDRDAVQDNLTTSWVYTGCDQKFRENFAWGYTKTQLDTWIDTNFTNAPSTQPITRTLRISDRGDGLFNAIMSERTFETVSATAPQFTITLPIGTNITRQTDYGYNYNATEMVSAANLKNRYNETVKAVGLSVDFRVTRQDDCSFDWQAVITEQSSDILGSIDTGTSGVWRVAYAMRGATTGEVAEIEASLKSGPRTNVTVSINMRDDNLADVQAGVVVVQENTDTFDSGVNGVRVRIAVGANADTVPTNMVSGKRVAVSPQIQPQGDGTYGYAIQERTVQENTNTYDSGAAGVRVQEYAGVNADTVPTNLVSSRLRSVSPQVQPQPDGTFNYNVTARTAVETNDSWTVGSRGEVIQIDMANNAESLDVTNVTSTSVVGANVELIASRDDAGNLKYTKRSTQRNLQSNSVAGGSYLYDVTVYSGTGDTNGPSDNTPTNGVTYNPTLRSNKDGSREWGLEIVSANPRESTLVTIARQIPSRRSSGYSESGVLYRNQTNVVGITNESVYGYMQNFRMNNDATFDYTKVTITYSNETFYANYPPSTGTTHTVNALSWDHMTRWDRKRYTNIITTNFVYWYSKQTRKMYLNVPYKVETKWRDDYVDAVVDISGGMQESRVTLVDIGGTTKWKSEKWTLVPDTNLAWSAHGKWLNTGAPPGYAIFNDPNE